MPAYETRTKFRLFLREAHDHDKKAQWKGRKCIMRMLLIDDNDDLLAAMADFFLHRGYEVQCAGETEEAVAMIRHHQFDVVIVDLELNSITGLDGFGVLKALRQTCARTQVIVYSGHCSQTIMDAALLQGGNKFISKPASLPHLLASVEGLCSLPC
jgi:DNA-binding response OmpR family regulator